MQFNQGTLCPIFHVKICYKKCMMIKKSDSENEYKSILCFVCTLHSYPHGGINHWFCRLLSYVIVQIVRSLLNNASHLVPTSCHNRNRIPARIITPCRALLGFPMKFHVTENRKCLLYRKLDSWIFGDSWGVLNYQDDYT